MASTEHEILRLRDQLARQQTENERLVELAKAELKQTKREIEWLQAQSQQAVQQSSTANNETTVATKGGKYFQNGDRVPSNKELAKIMDDPHQSAELFKELEHWIDSDREQREAARKSGIRPDEKRWFGEGRVPTADEMADPRSLQQMLKELDAM